jgi:hypothetical protein
MAVQLARLSLWLATLCRDRPLTFFDRQLRAGNSLVGAGVREVSTRRPGGRHRDRPLPLFEQAEVDRALGAAVTSSLNLREGPEDTLEDVRAKEQLFKDLSSQSGPLARWKQICDLWCAAWFADDIRRFGRGVFQSLGDQHTLPDPLITRLLELAEGPARQTRFFHWELEFPEVFYDSCGEAKADAGFDAVVGNPPWEMLRSDGSRSDDAARRLTQFARGSGIYPLQRDGHANLYQLFTERALSLTRKGGRIALVLPSGFATDHGSSHLRRHLLDHTSIDSFITVENRDAIFPIHRGLRFVLLTTARGGRTDAVRMRSGLRNPADFDALPDSGDDPCAVVLSREFLERFSGPQISIPDVRTQIDVAVAARLAFAHPAASDENGWGLRFARELNATDDKVHFKASRFAGALPVVAGKQIQPFRYDLSGARHFIDSRTADRIVPDRAHSRARLAYRDVAASTNRLTLIAAVLPSGVVTTHTLFCLRNHLDDDGQRFLCGMLNSFVANYLVRMRLSTHVTVALISRLPLPRPGRHSRLFAEMARLSRELSVDPANADAAACHQALAAEIYGLTAPEFEHILTTFPLVDADFRRRAMEAFLHRSVSRT